MDTENLNLKVASHTCSVVEHKWVNERYKHLQLESAFDLKSITKPGQFYQIKCPEIGGYRPFLLRPMSVFGVGPESNEIEFLYNVVGEGTKALQNVKIGEEIEIVGPLGIPFQVKDTFKTILLVARGVGLATMASLVKEANIKNIKLIVVMSAKDPKDLMVNEFLQGSKAEIHCLYDSDKSSNMDNFDNLVRKLIREKNIDAIYTCGSKRITATLQNILKGHPNIYGEVALEQRMACGMGACLSCVGKFNRDGEVQHLRVCREGPVFPINEVIFGA